MNFFWILGNKIRIYLDSGIRCVSTDVIIVKIDETQHIQR